MSINVSLIILNSHNFLPPPFLIRIPTCPTTHASPFDSQPNTTSEKPLSFATFRIQGARVIKVSSSRRAHFTPPHPPPSVQAHCERQLNFTAACGAQPYRSFSLVVGTCGSSSSTSTLLNVGQQSSSSIKT